MIDASAALSGLLNDGVAREMLGIDQVHAPHLIISEVASGLGRQVAADQLGAGTRVDCARYLASSRSDRNAVHPLLDRV